MRMVKLIACGLILTPVAELAAFLVVASLVGFAGAVVLLALISLAGLLVLRSAVFPRRRRRGPAGVDWGAAAGGILLLLPGFVTGLGGALMLHATIRKWLLGRVVRFGAPMDRPAASPSQVIELSPGEWQRLESREALGQRRGEP